MKFHRFVKFHDVQASARIGSGLHGSGTSPITLESMCVELSNATGIIENGHRDSAHEVSEVGVSKVADSATFNIKSGPRDTRDWLDCGT